MIKLADALAKPDKTIPQHNEEVATAMTQIGQLDLNLPLLAQHINTLIRASRLHDIGKANRIFLSKIIAKFNKKVKVYHSNISKNYITAIDNTMEIMAQLVSGHHGIWREDNNTHDGSIALNPATNQFTVCQTDIDQYIQQYLHPDDRSVDLHLLPLLEKYLILADRYASSGNTWINDLPIHSKPALNFGHIGGIDKLNEVQRQCQKLCNNKWYNNYDTMIIEAETGIGKTLAAMLAIPDNARILYLCPTRMLTDETSEKLKTYGLHDFITVHGDIFYNSTPNDKLGSVIKLGASSLCPRVIATIDQFAYAGKRCRYNVMGIVENTYIIIDEIHSYKHELSYIIKATEWWKFYGCKVIILSATIPQIYKNLILGNEQIGCSAEYKYPTILLGNNQTVDIVQIDGEVNVVKSKRLFFIKPDAIITNILDEFNNSSKIAYICNDVRTAQHTYLSIKSDQRFNHIKVILIHSKYVRRDRREIEHQIDQHMTDSGKLLVISTQVIEHGHDLDFDVMFTRWAPIDRIIQRAGRLHRRRYDSSEARLYIIESDEENTLKSEGLIYGEIKEGSLIKRSHDLLQSIGLITHDNIQWLVNQVYDKPINRPDTVPSPLELNDIWEFTNEADKGIRANDDIEVVLYINDNDLPASCSNENDALIRLPLWIILDEDERFGKLVAADDNWRFFLTLHGYDPEVGYVR